jgi:PadR family transcriptional regulator, regulatory protein AphA
MDVKTLCLGVLSAEDHSGYEIKRRCEEVFRHFFVAGFGSIYPALAELQRDGLVTVQSVEQKKRPDKKIYRITEAGRAALAEELVATPPRHKVRSEFLTLMYFAHLLPPARVDAVLGEMIDRFEATLVDELAVFDRDDAPRELTPGQHFALGYGRTVLTAALAYCKRQRPQLARALRGETETEIDDSLTLKPAHEREPEAANDRAPAAAPLAGE